MTAEEPGPRLYDVDIEQALLGAMLIDETAIARASATCDPDDFYDPLHQRLAAFMFKAHAEGKTVTPLTVGAGMAHDAGLVELSTISGGKDAKRYLISLAKGAPARPNVEDYSRILAELRAKRDAVDAMAYAQEVFAGDGTVAEALRPLIQVFDTAQARGQSPENAREIGDCAIALLREGEEAAQRKTIIAAPSGVKALDDVIGGLFPGSLICIGGRPGMGKSILATTICRAAAQAGWAPHFFSLEMSGRECAARMIADMDYDFAMQNGKRGLAYSNLMHNKGLTDDEWQRAIRAQEALAKLPIEVNTSGRLTIAQIGGLTRARAARLGMRVLPVIDHLHIVAPSERTRNRNRNDEITEITGAAKQLAKYLETPVVLLSQLTRDVEKRDDKHPQLADFRDSGSIEQDGDAIIALYRSAYYAAQALRYAKTKEAKANAETVALAQKHVVEMDVLKNRAGATSSINAWIDVRSSVIRDRDPNKIGPADDYLLALADLPEMRG